MIVIGSRGSALALWQAHYFQDLLAEKGHESRIEVIKTQGDNIQHLGFDKLEGKGFFTKELELALLDGNIDIAVHSLKDLPTDPVEGLVIGGLSQRADARDTLLLRPNGRYNSAKEMLDGNPIIGTSSLRRQSQLKSIFPKVRCVDIRGNVPTRIKKLNEGEMDAIVLAKAGLDRLEIDLEPHSPHHFAPSELVPAPGQGVLAYQTRTDNITIRKILRTLHQKEVGYCTNIERGVLNALDGGCQLPLGVHVEHDNHGNYIAHVAFDTSQGLRQFKIAQSTFDGMKDLILKQLKEK